MRTPFKTYAKLVIGISLLILPLTSQSVEKIKLSEQPTIVIDNGELSIEIHRQLFGNELNLYYPNSVKRFYQNHNFTSPWIKAQSGTGSTWQAMLMIDCVLQFGLSHDD